MRFSLHWLTFVKSAGSATVGSAAVTMSPMRSTAFVNDVRVESSGVVPSQRSSIVNAGGGGGGSVGEDFFEQPFSATAPTSDNRSGMRKGFNAGWGGLP